MPTIELTRNVFGDEAEDLKKCFSPGVIDVTINDTGEKMAVVENPRLDACTREVFRHEKLKVRVI